MVEFALERQKILSKLFRRQSRLSAVFLLLLILDFIRPAAGCFPGTLSGLKRLRARPEAPLLFKEHEPNFSEFDSRASGYPVGRIRRGDARFKELIYNKNPDIVFKDEEGNGEDHVMSRRCSEKLDLLAILVRNFWPGKPEKPVLLRVIEAWDEGGIHELDSLHYEGRALDLTTSDHDRLKCGMLARLAKQAGFDYVYYESRNHIHVSCKTDNAPGVTFRGCFPPDATVQLENGSSKRMDQLQIGDMILSVTFDGNNTISAYSPVLMFLDKNREFATEFVQIFTTDDRSLTLTPYHLVYARKRNFSATFELVFAKDVQIDDFLIFVHRSLTIEARVVSLRLHYLHGVYAPLTATGNIVVDGHLASCYASITSHEVAHTAMLPVRLFYSAFGTLFADNDAGLHPYARLLIGLNKMFGFLDFS